MKRVRVRIYGIVQGVFFRYNIQKLAIKLNLTGWVRNNNDGSVEAVFEGDEKNIRKMLKFCKKGPELAVVNKIDVIEEKIVGEKRFRIIY